MNQDEADAAAHALQHRRTRVGGWLHRTVCSRLPPLVHPELRTLYEHDQEDRRRGAFGPWMLVRDWFRRRHLNRLMAAGALCDAAAEDYFHAAMLLQHAPRVRDYWRAHELAQRSAELGYAPARWLVAASYDRWLMRQGKPQKYGTQYKLAHPAWQVWAWGRYRLWEVDPTTTDAERAEWGVPPLEIVREWADTLGLGRERPRLGPQLAVIEAGELRVEVQDISALWSVAPARELPPPAPLALEQAAGLPQLPADLSPCRIGDVLGATAPDGKVAVTWQREPLSASGAYVYHWRWAHAPVFRRVEPGGASGVLIGGEQDGSAVVICPAGSGACWVLTGWLGEDSLLAIAASLPSHPEVAGPAAAAHGGSGPRQSRTDG